MIGAGDKVAASIAADTARVEAAKQRIFAASRTQIDKDIETVMEFIEESTLAPTKVTAEQLGKVKAAQTRLARHLDCGRRSYGRLSPLRSYVQKKLKSADLSWGKVQTRYIAIKDARERAETRKSAVASSQGLRNLVGPFGFALPIFFLLGATPPKVSK